MKDRALLVADDHAVVREGLREIVKQSPGLRIAGEAADGDSALRLARGGGFDLLILDISLPPRNGMQVLHDLRAGGSALPVLFFTMHPAGQYADYARRQGAQGFVNKDEDSRTLLTAISSILDGGTYFPGSAAHRRGSGGDNPFSELSRREAEVMAGLLRGDSLDMIAGDLGIGAKSVTTYRRRLLDKLGVCSNAELATLAARHGQH
jgi:DNA-binding NarL/FixJ family response regulator